MATRITKNDRQVQHYINYYCKKYIHEAETSTPKRLAALYELVTKLISTLSDTKLRNAASTMFKAIVNYSKLYNNG